MSIRLELELSAKNATKNFIGIPRKAVSEKESVDLHSFNIVNCNEKRVQCDMLQGISAINFCAKEKNKNISHATIARLKTETGNRIEANYPWADTSKGIQAWMMTAETETFMKVGGLAEVATQLPDAFNKRFANDKKNEMVVLTPAYVGDDGFGKVASFTNKDGKIFYSGSEKFKDVELKKITSLGLNVANNRNDLKPVMVDIYSCEKNGTKYVLFRNDKYFNITPSQSNNKGCKGAYVLNNYNVGEVERMLVFSKATYKLMQKAKENKIDLTQPNILVANDWHTSTISSLMRYVAPIEADNHKISKDVLQYLDNTPIIHIAHNAQYQGQDKTNVNQLNKTLFELNTSKILKYAKDYYQENSPFKTNNGAFNSAVHNLNLADRWVAVSQNYANELCTAKELGCGLDKINRIRQENGTILGITNGYDKSKTEPNQKFMDNINNNFNLKNPLKPYACMYNDKGYEIKTENKQILFEFLNDLSKQYIDGKTPVKNVSLYRPYDCYIDESADYKKTPVITNIGRFDGQKGFDYFAEGVKHVIKNLKPEDEKPIIAVLGSGNASIANQLHTMKDSIAEFDEQAAARIFIFEGFSAPLRDILQTCSDFTAIPSKWEPCGLTQMEAMPKGSIPIATSTGGLVDTIIDEKDGFLTDKFFGYLTNEPIFDNKNPRANSIKNNKEAFNDTMTRALESFYKSPETIKQMSINGMKKDFSWDTPNGSLDKYIELFNTGTVK